MTRASCASDRICVRRTCSRHTGRCRARLISWRRAFRAFLPSAMCAQAVSSAWLQPSAKDPSVSSSCTARCRSEPLMSRPDELVFLFDVDNTLLDNDAIEADISAHVERQFGTTGCARFWALFETLRGEFGFADYLGTVQRYRLEAL